LGTTAKQIQLPSMGKGHSLAGIRLAQQKYPELSLNLKSKRRMHKLYERHVREPEPVWPTSSWDLLSLLPPRPDPPLLAELFQELWPHQRNVCVDAVPSEGLGLFSEWKMEASSLLDVTSCIQQHLVEVITCVFLQF